MTDSINATVDYTYDGLGQLASETTANGTTTYTYDTRGNRIGMSRDGIISQYTYDTGNRLLSQIENVGGVNEQQTTYTYDNNGNLILRQMGQLSGNASQAESVSLIGQTEEVPNSVQGASMVWYEYNSFGKLSEVSTDTGMQASYTYDATGRRASKTVNGVEKRHLWNDDRISAEADANDAITDTYFQLGSLSAHKTGNNLYYYIYDGLGSVVGMKNESQSGDATAMYNYDAFGNPLSDSMLTNPFRYCNEYYDAETDMIYLRNRYYDPSIGRFISEDPIRDGLNWYVYCGNNPVMFVDPSGLVVTRWDKENLSSQDLEQIINNDQIWKNGTDEQREQARVSSYNIRKKYLAEGQKLLENGYVEEKISNEINVITSITGTVIRANVNITRIYTEKYKYVQLNNVYIKVKTASGFSVDSMKVTSGQTGLLSKKNVQIDNVYVNNYSFSPNWGRVIDDGGVYTIVGSSLELKIARPGKEKYESILFNQLYNQEFINENGKIISNVDEVETLQEALMRGER